MALTFRLATLGDSALLYQWRQQSEQSASWWNGTPVTLKTHRRWLQERLNSPAVRIWIAEENNQPVGHARLDSNGELTVEIIPEQRGDGRGTKLIVAASHLAAELGHTRIKASVDQTNLSARKAFENAGYEHRPDVLFYLWKP